MNSKPTPSTSRAVSLTWILLYSTMPVMAQTTWTTATRNRVPDILSAGLTPGGFRLEMAAPPGNYVLQRSTNLLPESWQDVGPIDPVSGSGERTDAAALSLPKAFYRVAGGFQETEMNVIAFDSMISSVGYLEYGLYAGLWTGRTQENLVFQSANPANGLVKLMDGESAKFRIEPTNTFDVISAYMERWNDEEVLPLEISGSSWSFPLDEGSPTLFQLEGGNHSLLGISRDSFQYQETDGFGTYVNNEIDVESIWAIAKSENANPSDLAGSWGFVRILVDGLGSDAVFNGEAWHTTFTSGSNPRPFSIASYTDFDIEHMWPLGDVDAVYNSLVVHSPTVTATLDLETDGSTIIETDGGLQFKGMVSPSAKLLVATAIDPDTSEIPEGESEIFLSGLNGGVSEWLVGVKKTNTPQLAGKTYRILRKGWWIDGGEFEIDSSGQTDQLVFNATGNSVTRTSEFNFDAVSFDGVLDAGSDAVTLPMSASVDGQGKVLLQGGVDGDFTMKTFGYVQEGSNLLVLIDSIESTENGVGLGLIIAIHEP